MSQGSSPVDRARLTLRVNGTVTLASATALVVAAGPIDRILGTGQPGWLRLVGVGLALFAVDVALVSRARERWLLRGTLVVAAADVAWVIASVVAVAAGWFEPAGVALVLATAAVVAGLAAAELSAARAARPVPAPA